MILIFVILNADTQLIPQLKKELLIHRFMHSIMDLLESTPDNNTGLFSTLSLRYTNVYSIHVDSYYRLISMQLLQFISYSHLVYNIS